MDMDRAVIARKRVRHLCRDLAGIWTSLVGRSGGRLTIHQTDINQIQLDNLCNQRERLHNITLVPTEKRAATWFTVG